jgi:hypothetical protein
MYGSVGIATDYGAGQSDDRGSFLARAGNFSLRHPVQTGGPTLPVSHPMATRGSSPGGTAAGAWN